MRSCSFLFLLVLLPLNYFAQINGTVKSSLNNEPIYGAKIESSEGHSILSNIDGLFQIRPVNYPISLTISIEGFLNDSLVIYGDTTITLQMVKSVEKIENVVVSASRRRQKVEEVPISMEIIRPELINNKGLTNLEQVLDQTPGAFVMDGQVSIRGGGGYAYGAGSRVLALWNGIPLNSPDIGDIKWNAIPLEQTSQIEVVKGASSVLYGSGALNGTISMIEKEPTAEGDLKVKFQSGIYGNPRRESLKWWKDTIPTSHLAEVYFGKQIKNFGMTIGGQGFYDLGYRKRETEWRGRINGSFSYRIPKHRLKFGLSYNFQYQFMGLFILWRSAEEAYESDNISEQRSIRGNIDPYVKYIDKQGNIHTFRTRYYMVSTGNSELLFTAAKSQMIYLDYNFQKLWGKRFELTTGITNTNNSIKSTVFGDHRSLNVAAYVQGTAKFGRFDITGGARFEFIQMDTLAPDSRMKITDSLVSPIYPILRAGAHYALTEATHLRASIGQAIRFPAVAERFVATSNGAVVIVPSPNITAETGWSAEIGVKQLFKIKDWKAYVDVAAFVNQYKNMVEFNFGVFNPHNFDHLDVIGANPNQEDLDTLSSLYDQGFSLSQLIGFQAQNTERARITGIELSMGCSGKIKGVEISSMIGYTYMNPVNLNKDPKYTYYSSDSSNILKYRFRHLVKGDIEVTYKNISLGASTRFNSYIRNIDKIFEVELPDGTYALPGLYDYRHSHMKGNLVFDLRLGYKLKDKFRFGFIINNLFNREYEGRPGDIQAPRNFILQLQYDII
ncbi:MAG: TonB-dependent receptor [Bacteroidota bacterium]